MATTKTILAYSNNRLALLKQQINQQLTVLKTIKSALPAELAEHVLHCVPDTTKLTVYTDSPVWASQLRFYRESILKTVSPTETLDIKVIIPTNTGYVLKKPSPHIPSPLVISGIKSFSLSLDDQTLKESLEKLSATLSRFDSKKS